MLAKAEMLLALEDTHHSGHVALVTPGSEANLEQQAKLNFSKGLG